MTFQQKDKPSGHFPHTERTQQFQRPPYFHKGSTSSLDPLLAKSNTGTSTPGNRPRSRATTVASFRTNAYASSTVSTRKPTVRKLQYSGFSSDSIATGPERLENLAKTLIARGSKLLKRQSSIADSASIRTVEWLGGSEGKMGKHKSQPNLHPNSGHQRMNSTDTNLRRHISEPYNFQHLTHTHANQFQTLQKTSHSELVSEFSAIRASQIPCRDLQGIKAESLQSSTVSPEVTSGPSSPVRSDHTPSPPLSPVSPLRRETRRFGSHAGFGSISYTRGVENFSQPGPKSYKPRPSPITPPPRISSKYPGSEYSSGNHEPLSSPTFSRHQTDNGSSAVDNSVLANVSTTHTTLQTEDDLFDYSTTPHAVSTPDGTALTLKPLLFENLEKDLPGLPEEVETEKINVPTPPQQSLRPLRHAKSFPSTKSSSRRWSRTSPRVSPDGLISPLIDGPPLAEAVIPSTDHPLDDIPFRPRLSRRISSGLAKFDECWEEEVDYCYEHAAEADCDFDWDRVLNEDERKDVSIKHHTLDVELNQQSVTHSNDSKPPTRRCSSFYLPPLQPPSAESNSSSRDSSKSSTLSINGPATPSQSLLSPIALDLPGKETQDSGISPVFIPRDFEAQLIQDDVYQRLLAGDHVSEQIYSFHDGSYETSSSKGNSPRSSRSQTSKNASQESFAFARSASICHQRDNESVGSLPELVFSRWNYQTNDLLGVCAPRSQPEKPLPQRPKLSENHRQQTIRPSKIQSSMMWSQSSNDPNHQVLVSSPPQVPSKSLGERNLSSEACRDLGELTSPSGFASQSRRFGSSRTMSTRTPQPPNTSQTAPAVFLSVPF
ncbi:hypothetical protein MMC22_005561 [Lobaria immixta]|nr:hypothetical protein [Lobaria immixta]